MSDDDDAPKDPHAASRHLTGGDWTCSECGTKNVSFATLCTGCGGLASKVKKQQVLVGAFGMPVKPGSTGPVPAAPKKGSGGVLALLLLLVVAGAAGGLWYMGKADPYLPENLRHHHPDAAAPETTAARH